MRGVLTRVNALVLQYFSVGCKKSSHAVPKEIPDAYLERVSALQETEIDQYAIAAANPLDRKLRE